MGTASAPRVRTARAAAATMSSSLRASCDSSASSRTSGRLGGQLRHQYLHPPFLGQRRVVRMHPGPGQQFADDLFVGLGVLPHVQPAKVETEGVQRIPKAGQPVVGQQRAAVRPKRGRRSRRGRPASPRPDRRAGPDPVRARASAAGPRRRWRSAARAPPEAPGGTVRRRGPVARPPQTDQVVVDRHEPYRHRELLLERNSSSKWCANAVSRPRCR